MKSIHGFLSNKTNQSVKNNKKKQSKTNIEYKNNSNSNFKAWENRWVLI